MSTGYYVEDDATIVRPSFCRNLKYHSDTVSMLAFNSNNKQLVSSSFDNHVLIWDLTNPSKKALIGEGHKSLINDISLSPSGFMFATASSDHTVRIWSNTNDYSSQEGNIQSQVIKFNSAPVKSVDFSCDSRLICTGSDDKSVKIISVADKKLQANLTNAHKNWVKCTRFSRDSKIIASSSDDKTLKIWDVTKKTLCYTFEKEHKGPVNCVRFHPDNSCLATACYDGKIRLFDIRSKQLVQTYPYHTRPAFHPSGNFLASTSYDECIKLYDLRMGDILFTLKAHEGAVTSIAFSTFGDYFATGGLDSNIVVWESNLEQYMDLGQDDMYSNEVINLTTSKPFNEETKLNYKNKMMKETYTRMNDKDNASEGLTKIFDKMVSQMDMITSSFLNFEQRVSKMEEMLDEMN